MLQSHAVTMMQANFVNKTIKILFIQTYIRSAILNIHIIVIYELFQYLTTNNSFNHCLLVSNTVIVSLNNKLKISRHSIHLGRNGNFKINGFNIFTSRSQSVKLQTCFSFAREDFRFRFLI